jgi:hypothetical protein
VLVVVLEDEPGNNQKTEHHDADDSVAASPRCDLTFTVRSRTCTMATAVSGRCLRAASAGSPGQANPQALIGQSPLPILAPSS